MTRPGRELSDDEAALFRETLRDAKPLAARPKRPPPEKPKPPPPKPVPPKPEAARPAPVPAAPPPRAAPELHHRAAPGVDKRTFEKFRRGEMAIDARLDLHGMTQDAAHAALTRFIAVNAAAGNRCLLIVTGKGGRDGKGVLRAQVPRWLNESSLRPALLAFAHARPKDGGDGALYVLLKRRR